MNRDKFKSDEYFESYIASQNERIAKFSNIMNGFSEEKREEKIMCGRYLAGFYIDLFYAKYSAGANGAELKSVFDEYLKYIGICGIGSYSETVNLLSIAYLLGYSYKNFSDFIDFDEYEDSLTSFLMTAMGRETANKHDLLFPTEYGKFWEFARSEISLEEFKKYMEESWYVSRSEYDWYDTHLSDDDIYVGYWCWPAAALLKYKHMEKTEIIYVPHII